jgi:hypothetical protein
VQRGKLLDSLTLFCFGRSLLTLVQPLRLRLRIGYSHPSAGQVMDQVNWAEPS